MLQHSLEGEAQLQLGVARHQRSPQRCDHRSGHYTRSLDTPGGCVDDLRVPRSRNGTHQPQVFDRYERRVAQADETILGIVLAGASTRRVGPVLEVLTGHVVSASTVSRVAKALDEHVRAYHQRPLQDRYRYLIVDGIRLRGLEGNALQLVTTDGAPGLIAALDMAYPRLRRQCC